MPAHCLARLLFVAGSDGLPYGVVLLLESDSSARLLIIGGEYRLHVVVEQVDRLLNDPLEQRIVGGLSDSGVEGHIFLRRDLIAGGGEGYREPVEVFYRGPPGC